MNPHWRRLDRALAVIALGALLLNGLWLAGLQ